MTTPTWVTDENIKFDGELTPAAVFDVTDNVRTLVVWDDLPGPDQSALVNLVDSFGGTIPLAAPYTATQTIGLRPKTIGATSTGLDATSTTTAGKATIDLGASKAGGDPSGLSSSLGTSGYAVANLQPGVTGATNLGLTAPIQGKQTLNYGGLALGASATGLANTATAYTMTVTVDGVAKPISVVGSAAQTFTALVAEINVDLGASATAAIVSGNIVITSATYGTSSTVTTVDGTLLAATTGFVSIAAPVNGSGTTSYTASVSIDGVAYPLTVNPLTVTTFTQLLAYINGVITTNGTASISNGDVRITSASFGILSKVRITPGTLFPALVGYTNIIPPADGGGVNRAYSATVTIDGTIIKTVSFQGKDATTLTAVLSQINTDLAGTATAAIAGGDVVITSATTGINSSVSISDSGFLFASLTGYTGISYTAGSAPVTYTASVTVTRDGVPTTTPVSLTGNNAQTFTTLVSVLNAQLGSANIQAALSGSSIVVTASNLASNTVKISINGGTLLPAIDLVDGLSVPTPLVHSFLEVLALVKTANGSSFLSTLPIRRVGLKPSVPPYVKHTLDFVYFNGTDYVYLDDDTPVN
jgi:hypothetical protein